MSDESLFLRVEPPADPPFRYYCREGNVVVGRSSSADVCVQDRFLSRQHARLFREKDGWNVETLSARSPTLLNGTAIEKPSRVSPGDVLYLGKTVVRIAPSESEAVLAVDAPASRGTRILRPASTFLDTESPSDSADAAALSRQTSRLAMLNEVHHALARPISHASLLELILDRAFAHLAPEEAAIYLVRPDGELEQAASRRVPGLDAQPFHSRSLADEVVGRGLAALVQDASLDDRFATAESILLSGIRSILAAPLLDAEGSLGMIVLHSRAHVGLYSEEDMALLVSLASAAALRIRNLALSEEAAERRLLEKELALASEIQTGMLPREFPERPEFELGAVLQPARMVGGDLYDAVADGSRLWFVVGDVSGKGVGAALFMAVMRTLFRAVVPTAPALGEAFDRINVELARDNDKAMFVTAFAGCLDLSDGHLEFVNAGHIPPVRLGADGELEAVEAPPGLPLGAMSDYSYVPRHLTLRPGDGLFLYTDGITEAENEDKEQFSVTRLLDSLGGVVADPAAEVVAAVIAAVRAHAGDTPPSDDLTALVLRYRGAT